jgi:D-arabinose 1-dehydrogenase-like Zn-dependent alcohol dehydrogenase
MRGYLALSGALLCAVAVLLMLSIWRWEIGPEFWPAVPGLGALGVLMLREVRQ